MTVKTWHILYLKLRFLAATSLTACVENVFVDMATMIHVVSNLCCQRCCTGLNQTLYTRGARPSARMCMYNAQLINVLHKPNLHLHTHNNWIVTYILHKFRNNRKTVHIDIKYILFSSQICKSMYLIREHIYITCEYI